MFHDRRRYVNTKVWPTQTNNFKYPELHDPELKCAWLDQKDDLGVAFSGGGTRSASSTLGQLRALKTLGWLDKKVKYISAVSGGSWAATPYTYLPDSISDQTFLGPSVLPEQLTLRDLDYARPKSLASAISDSVITDDFLIEALKLGGDETYARAVGNIFLEPFGLDDNSKFFTFHEQARDTIVSNNHKDLDQHYHLKAEDFYVVKNERPYLVVGGTVLRERNPLKTRKLQVEYTPLYSGVKQYFEQAGRRSRAIGGGFIQSHAYDSKTPDEVPTANRYRVKVGRRYHRFTLSDVVGSSGAAPEEFVRELGFFNLGFPEFRHWPLTFDDNQKAITDEEEYAHGDGGHLENVGIMPLLARKVTKIIVFINTPTPFKENDYSFTDDLAPLFGRKENTSDSKANVEKIEVNQVLDMNKLDELLAGLDQCKSKGEPLVYADTYTVLKNEHYGIDSYEAKICWVYNNQVKNWENSIKDSSVKKLLAESDDFNNFPHYKTFLQNPPNIIDLSLRQVNLLAHLSHWCVINKAGYIKHALDIQD